VVIDLTGVTNVQVSAFVIPNQIQLMRLHFSIFRDSAARLLLLQLAGYGVHFVGKEPVVRNTFGKKKVSLKKWNLFELSLVRSSPRLHLSGGNEDRSSI
jgi:hypothetical protein